MNKKAKNIIVGAVAIANISTPITTLAYNTSNSSNTTNLNSRAGVNAKLSGNTVATSDINLRSSASWSGDIIQVIKKGEPVFVVSESNGWAKVEHNEKSGYVPSDYLQATNNNKTVTASVNLRETASWSGNIIHVIKAGESVVVVSTSGEWTKVQHKGSTGYVPTEYIDGASNTSNSGSTTSKTVTEAVNLRETASWSGNIIHVIKAGEAVTVVSTSGDWTKVTHNGKTGYIPSTYISGNSNSSNGSTTSKTVTEAVNLRETASWSGNIIHVIKAGEAVTVVSTSGDWTKVTHNGKTGYIPSTYISGNSNSSNGSSEASSNIEAMSATGKVVNLGSSTNLNVRSGPGTTYGSIGTLSAGATVKITGKDKNTNWYRIDYNGKEGYVSNNYIEITTGNTSTSTTYKKTTANLNMRSSANTNASIITTIPSGTVVTVLSSSNGWDYVEYNGQKGYCSSSYLTSTNEVPTIKKITTANLNMRTGAGTSYSIITTIPSGTVVDVLSTSNGWAKIKYNGQEGYVSTDYLDTYTGDSTSGSGNLPASKPNYSKVKIVIDPGHGGTDPGAIGFGLQEKDAALSISKKINANLKTLGFETIMTRTTDVYVTLANRYTIANNAKADLFLSVHLNSATSSSANGIETLYKNSQTFASNLQNEMISATNATNRGLKHRTDLAVLNGTKMTAALVETGFISNPTESAKLATGSYQDRLATAIAKGIAKYTDNNISK